MAKISGDVVEEVRNHFDIADVIASYIDLKKTGRNYVGLCPFHSEKTPSFSVSPEKQIFHCFGCQTGGNLFTFIMQMEGLSFPEAVRYLGEKAGIQVDYRPVTPEEKRRTHLREELQKLHALAQKYYQHCLWESSQGKNALQYLYNRGIEKETIQEFGLGYAPDGWENLVTVFKKKGHDLDLALKSGLINQKTPGRYFDYFRHRLMFPIMDRQGKIIAFGGRIMGNQEPKYLNSPETELFNKRKTLYGFHQALPFVRQSGEALIVEGYMDVILLYQHQIRNAVAPLGTSLTADQVSLLRGRLETLTLAFDADSGGQTATIRALELAKNEGFRTRVAVLPDEMDPADYVYQYGGEAFQQNILEAALPLVEYQLYLLKKKNDLSTEEGRVNYWKSARKILAALSEPVEKEEYLKKIGEEINVSLEVLRGDLEKIIRGTRRSRGQESQKSASNTTVTPREKVEKELLSCLLREPSFVPHVFRRLQPEDFTPGPYHDIAMCMVARAREENEVDPASLLGYFSDPEMHKLIMKLAFPGLQENHFNIKKTINDCIRKMKSLRWSEEREQLIKSLQKETNREKVSATLQRIRDLKKWEDELNRPGEGEDFCG